MVVLKIKRNLYPAKSRQQVKNKKQQQPVPPKKKERKKALVPVTSV
jgi:hypothetical protein